MIIRKDIHYKYETCVRVRNSEDNLIAHELPPLSVSCPVYFDEEIRDVITPDFLETLREEIGWFISPMELDFIEVEEVSQNNKGYYDVNFEGDGFTDRTCFMELYYEGQKFTMTIVRKVWS